MPAFRDMSYELAKGFKTVKKHRDPSENSGLLAAYEILLSLRNVFVVLTQNFTPYALKSTFCDFLPVLKEQFQKAQDNRF